jgi:hypothetical protein
MASSNTKFKVENGLDVVGSANVSGVLRVESNLSVGGNLLTTLNLAGDIKPTSNNTLNLGSSTFRWGYLYANNVDVFSNVSIGDTLTGNNYLAANVIATVNNAPLGSATRRWAFYANTVDFITGTVGNTTDNTTISGTSIASPATGSITIGNTVGNVTLTQSTITVGNTTVGTVNAFALNIGANVNVSTTQINVGNATVNTTVTSSAASLGGTLTVAANVVIDTDTFTLDAVNNRIGFKTGLASLSANAIATVTGNVEFNTSGTGVRFIANSTVTASTTLVANTTNNKFTFTTFDSGTATVLGGYQFVGSNATVSQVLLELNNTQLQYKGGNVATSSNFGIYNVSGTRLGP